MREHLRNMKTAKQRQAWIDVLKGVGMILVVIGHTSEKNVLNDWVYTFHMPLFFALSGYLWEQKSGIDFKSFLFKRVRSILWPFVLFRFLLVLYWLVVESHFRSLDLGPIWFLIVLFIAEIAAFLLLAVAKNKREEIIINCLLLIALPVIWIELEKLALETTYYAWFLRCLNGLLWYLLGHLGRLIQIGNIVKYNHRNVALAVLFAVSICICIINPGASMWSNEYGNSYPLYLAGGISGSLFVALTCKNIIKKNIPLEFLGKNSIVILATHEPIKRVVLKVAEFL